MAASIVVIEDDNITRQSLCEALRNDSYQVAEATDGSQALELLKNQSFDLIIADFVLPKLHGFYLVDIIHAQWPKIPMIVISGYLSASAAKVLLAGAAEFIPKPVDFKMLLSTVRRLLALRFVSTATKFRRRMGSEIWHFCTNCSTWPANDYHEQISTPRTGEFCNECKAKSEKGNCLW
jgi:DNA-binding NtrC family response regulator